MTLSTLICDPLTIKWLAGPMKIPAYDTFRDGSEPDVECSRTRTRREMMLTQGNIGFLLQGATGKHSVFFFQQRALGRRFYYHAVALAARHYNYLPV